MVEAADKQPQAKGLIAQALVLVNQLNALLAPVRMVTGLVVWHQPERQRKAVAAPVRAMEVAPVASAPPPVVGATEFRVPRGYRLVAVDELEAQPRRRLSGGGGGQRPRQSQRGPRATSRGGRRRLTT